MGSPSRVDLHRPRRSRLRRALAVPLAGLVLAGGSMLGGLDPASGQEADDDTRAAKAEWTFMTYMVADNNLEPDALDDLLEMADAGSDPNVNVVAFIDRSDEFSEEPVGDLEDFTTAKLIHIQDGELEEIEDFGEVNSGSPQTLAWFIKTAAKMFPAKKYGLSLWDHGGGWQGYGIDDSAGAGMKIPDVVSALSGGLRGAGIKKLEFLGFDACLMQTYEIAAAMQPFAKWYLASEEYEPAHGWDYHGLEAIINNPALKGKALGKSLIRSYIGQAEDQGTDAEVTLSLVNLKSMPKVVSALKGLVRAANADMENVAQTLATEGSNAVFFGGASDPTQALNLVDLGDLLARLGENVPDEVAVARASVYEALDRTVVDMQNGALYEQATGMAVYLPLFAEYYSEAYETIPDPAGWRTLLESYYEAAGELAPPSGDFTFVGDPVLEVTPDGALISAELPAGSGADVVAAYADLGIVEGDGSIVYLLSQPAVVGAGDPDVIQSGWGYNYVLLSDGATSIPVFISLEPTETGFAAWAEVFYDGPSGSGDATLMLSLDDEFDVVGATLYLFQANGTTSELTPEPGSTLTPLLLVVDPSGGFTFEPLGDGSFLDGSAPLGIEIGTLPPGTPFVYGLTAYDVAGNSAFTSAEGVIP